MSKIEPMVLVHGGAGQIRDNHRAAEMVDGVKRAANEGYTVLRKTGSVLEAVEAAVRHMEHDENFNAGRGSILNLDGEVEMDASIMLGSDLSAGAVTVIKDIAHPITVAKLVMQRTTHVLLAGEGAKTFARKHGIEILPPGALVTDAARENLTKLKLKSPAQDFPDTVGAVAIDGKGRLAAATSTGGRSGKMAGRSSDTCMIGCGTYADDNIGAVSTTGHGESITKVCLAHDIIKEMQHGLPASEATKNCLDDMNRRVNNTGGAITLSKEGGVGVYFNTYRMPWAYRKGKQLHFGVNHFQDDNETIT